jgi:gamma-glutamyl hercynylcysteine S-oxide hydrolase
VCRHLAYLGPPIALHDALFAAPHALAEQSRHPCHQTSGHTNPDGWGVGWYGDDAAAPERHRTVTPIWDDEQFATRAREIRAGAFLAAARLASPGATVDVAGNAPFRSDRWLFSLNGIVHGFTAGVGDQLRAAASAPRRAAIASDADTEVLFALVLDRLDRGEPAEVALANVVHDVRAITTGRLNLLLADGQQVAGTRVGNSLFARAGIVASEPLDDTPGWTEVPDDSVVRLTRTGLEVQPL